jgi:hypothetical protein
MLGKVASLWQTRFLPLPKMNLVVHFSIHQCVNQVPSESVLGLDLQVEGCIFPWGFMATPFYAE